jgi:hypothetical protein
MSFESELAIGLLLLARDCTSGPFQKNIEQQFARPAGVPPKGGHEGVSMFLWLECGSHSYVSLPRLLQSFPSTFDLLAPLRNHQLSRVVALAAHSTFGRY